MISEVDSRLNCTIKSAIKLGNELPRAICSCSPRMVQYRSQSFPSQDLMQDLPRKETLINIFLRKNVRCRILKNTWSYIVLILYKSLANYLNSVTPCLSLEDTNISTS